MKCVNTEFTAQMTSVTKNAEGGTGSRLASHPQTSDAQYDRLVSREPQSSVREPLCCSHHRADATVLGLGASGCLGGCRRRAVVVGAVSRVGGVC